MNFRVIWSPAAEQELTHIWLNSRFRSHITEAASLLDEKLQRAPHAAGESRDEGVRIIFSPPLGVRCYIDDASRTVIILNVWQIGVRR
jgi:plasmid stabilization system protein ParE